MAEWSIAAVLKTVELRGSGGSNPSLSAKIHQRFLMDFLMNVTDDNFPESNSSLRNNVYATVNIFRYFRMYYYICSRKKLNTGVAQLVEHWSPKPGVGSSSLSSRAGRKADKKWGFIRI